MLANFREYIVIGGMPAIVDKFVTNNNYSGTLKMQRQILLDYEEDITKYAQGLDKGKILNIYRKIPVFLGKENKKFQISKVSKNARNRDYIGTVEWLDNAGIINISGYQVKVILMCRVNPKKIRQPENFKECWTS